MNIAIPVIWLNTEPEPWCGRRDFVTRSRRFRFLGRVYTDLYNLELQERLARVARLQDNHLQTPLCRRAECQVQL